MEAYDMTALAIVGDYTGADGVFMIGAAVHKRVCA